MKITNPIDYIVLGGRIRYFAGRKESDVIFGNNYIYDNLTWFRDDLEKLGFTVSKNLFDRKLLPLKKEFEKDTPEKNDGTPQVSLTANQAERLVNTILEFEYTVFAEAETRVIAAPTPRRFQLEHLINEPGRILGNGVYNQLSKLAQHDISEACRCIAFECPTAAAFHILRAIEECIRLLYKAYFPRRDATRAWGILTNELKTKPQNPKPDIILITHLDHLRTRFRNPTDHPDKIYEIEEVEDLVHISVDIINRCVKDRKLSKNLTKN